MVLYNVYKNSIKKISPMHNLIKIICILLIFNLFSCKPKTYHLDVSNTDLESKENLLYYKNQPFSGTLSSKVDTVVINEANYLNGKKHGKEQKLYANGEIAVLRFYQNGKKSGIHKAWWNNGQLKFVRQFDNYGNPTGIQQEWYSNGKLAKELHYMNGNGIGFTENLGLPRKNSGELSSNTW